MPAIEDVCAPPQGEGASIFLIHSDRFVRVLGVRIRTWAHVAVLVVDRARKRATVYDLVVSSSPSRRDR